jgi:hypothetical protein
LNTQSKVQIHNKDLDSNLGFKNKKEGKHKRKEKKGKTTNSWAKTPLTRPINMHQPSRANPALHLALTGGTRTSAVCPRVETYLGTVVWGLVVNLTGSPTLAGVSAIDRWACLVSWFSHAVSFATNPSSTATTRVESATAPLPRSRLASESTGGTHPPGALRLRSLRRWARVSAAVRHCRSSQATAHRVRRQVKRSCTQLTSPDYKGGRSRVLPSLFVLPLIPTATVTVGKKGVIAATSIGPPPRRREFIPGYSTGWSRNQRGWHHRRVENPGGARLNRIPTVSRKNRSPVRALCLQRRSCRGPRLRRHYCRYGFSVEFHLDSRMGNCSSYGRLDHGSAASAVCRWNPAVGDPDAAARSVMGGRTVGDRLILTDGQD